MLSLLFGVPDADGHGGRYKLSTTNSPNSPCTALDLYTSHSSLGPASPSLEEEVNDVEIGIDEDEEEDEEDIEYEYEGKSYCRANKNNIEIELLFPSIY